MYGQGVGVGSDRGKGGTYEPEGVDDLGTKKAAVASQEDSPLAEFGVRGVGGVGVGAVGVHDEALAGEEAHGDHSPESIPGVHGDGVQRVVQLHRAVGLGKQGRVDVDGVWILCDCSPCVHAWTSVSKKLLGQG